MNNIEIVFLGEPQVFLNNKQIYFPYKKAEALFYYLFFEKSATRNSLTDIFWGNSNEKSARKNLRDALYNIKKTFGFDILISPKQKSIHFNNQYLINTDLDNLSKYSILDIYNGDFMNGFSLDDCYLFEEWLIQKREYFKKIYISAIKNKITESDLNTNIKEIEKYSNIILNEDPYNEEEYCKFMQLYAERGEFNRALSLYYKLSSILKNDLDVEPDCITQDTFNQIIKMRKNKIINESNHESFIGRKEEISKLDYLLNKFELNQNKSIFITGEGGIGKTYLINKFINMCESKDLTVFKSKCLEIEQTYYLRSWNEIFQQISTVINDNKIKISPLLEDVLTYNFPSFNIYDKLLDLDSIEKIESVKYKLTVDAVYTVLKKLSENKKYILIFDDIQWMDSFSLNLLLNLIPSLKNILFVCTYREDYIKKLEEKLLPINKNNLSTNIKLNRLTKSETADFIKEYSHAKKIDSLLLEKIYMETEGNTLFIAETIKLLSENNNISTFSTKMEDIIKSRLYSLTDLEYKILNMGCVFYNKIELNFLINNIDNDDFEIFNALESLTDKQLIKEFYSPLEGIYYQFTHYKYREYLYLNQSKLKKQILHNKIGNYLESYLCGKSQDKQFYPGILYHYKNSNNKIKTLEYSIKYLSLYSNVKFELFPSSFDSYDKVKEKLDFKESFKKIDTLLKNSYDDSLAFINYKMQFIYLKGKYYISECNYNLGLKYITEFIEYAENTDDYKNKIKAYKEMIFYSMQTDNITVMNKYLKKLEYVINEHSDIEESGTFYRFKGIYLTKLKNYDYAREFYNKSINIFENLNKINNNYALNIAASFNCLGDLNKCEKNYVYALNYYKKAIKICEENHIMKGLDLFYSNAGRASYILNKIDLSEKYLLKSLDLYNKFETNFGKAITECYYAILLFNKGNHELAKNYLNSSEISSNNYKIQEEINFINKTKRLIN